jgi:subtilisin family serine protease
MKRRIGRSAAVLATGLAALLVTGVGLAGSPATTDGGSAATSIDTGSAIVQLKGAPLSTDARTKPPKGKKIDFDSGAVKSYRAQLNNLRNDFKKWLRDNAPAAKVTGEFDISLNAVAVQLNGTPLATIAAAPMVQRAEYQGVYTPQVIDPDLTLINAFAAWGGGGGTAAGLGVKVAVIDTGIDASHPCFGTGGENGGTNAKVIFAGVFHNKTGSQGYTPADENGHGTHVAGTVACQYGLTNSSTSVDGVTVGYGVLGVAPAALLGNFNVFPDDVANARSEDILNALEAAYEKGFDIANMSLSGGSSGVQDLLSDAVDDLDQAGMISAVAAGNNGPGFFTVGSPGIAPRALTAGAVSVGHYIGVDVTNDDDAATYGAAIGDFGPTSDTTGDLTANLGTYCAGGGTHTGKIALIDRGVCAFSQKIRNAQNAGAVGAIIVNNVWGPPIAMGTDGTPNQPTIPGVMVSRADRAALSGAGSTGDTFTIHSARTYVQNLAESNYLAGFSSRGPTDVDFRVKPDVTAPGVNVLSSQPSWACGAPPCWAFFQGTSMATPHLAGSAAVVLGQHPSWAAWQVRSAIVNTADPVVLDGGAAAPGTPITAVNAIGSGLEDLDAAVDAGVALDPVSVSFGAVPSGSGRSDTRLVSLSTLGTAAATVAVTNETCAGVDFGATLSGATITVTMVAAKGIPEGSCQGILRLFDGGGGEIAHAAVYALVK